MNRCQSCGRFPMCNREDNDGCERWIKRDVEMKLSKRDGDCFEFERVTDESDKC